ncbi:MAG TPA: M20/M25/M40 family metallo-hydrolase, partial [Vicinamibacterales bacterium]
LRTIPCAVLLSAAATLPFAAQERVDADINAKIRDEGMNRSQVMRTLHYLADVYGPRVTGSPQLKAAGEWAIREMTSWGMTNGHLEPWDFGHPGWVNERLAVHVTSPVKDSLVAEALAWTPGTDGKRVTAKALNLVVPDGPEVAPSADAPQGRGGRGPQRLGPTEAELTAYLDSIKSQVAGAAVLVGRPTVPAINFNAPSLRTPDEQVRQSYDPNAPAGPGRGNRGGGAGRGRGDQPADRLTAAQVAQKIDAFLVANKAALRINDAARPHGQIIAFNNRTYDPAAAIPTIVMRNEDYGRIARILADKTPVTLDFEIVNTMYPEGNTAYNTIAEIPGTDKKDEVIMLGGHLDSWHSATGATDNAIGCAIMMEAARILKALKVQPRRTIRVALWSGEEEGLLGSLAYVKEHFGSFEQQKPEWKNLVAYLNIDTGTGRLRGASVFGPPSAARTLAEMFKPFEEFGIYGASATTSRATGGTDSTSFNNAGLPGVGFRQDPIEYNSHTHHTNLDTYERVIPEDVKQAAVIVASTIYHLSMRDEALARFASSDMPAPPAARGSGQ